MRRRASSDIDRLSELSSHCLDESALQVGVKLHEKSGAVIVDEQSRTNLPSIWAVGDVTDRIALTPVALMEGMAFARNAFGGDSSAAPDYEAIASAVFSSPPLASVGLTEEEAKEKYKNLDIFTSSFRWAVSALHHIARGPRAFSSGSGSLMAVREL